MMSDLIFFAFKLSIIFCSLLVVLVTNPVHSVISLILVFCNVTFLLLYLGIEFLGIVFLIVYVGAIAVLFLFVVMMLNIRYIELTAKDLFYLPFSLLIILIPSFFIIFPVFSIPTNFAGSEFNPYVGTSLSYVEALYKSSNVELIGLALYSSEFFLIPIFCSLILLIAMVGAVFLIVSLNGFTDKKKQVLINQLQRDFKKNIKLYK
jgi:NADH:ubiquinone oxidoreductase subunit 6 (subunit J)